MLKTMRAISLVTLMLISLIVVESIWSEELVFMVVWKVQTRFGYIGSWMEKGLTYQDNKLGHECCIHS